MTDQPRAEASGMGAHNPFNKKGRGRIFVADEGRIPRVLEILREIDEWEFEGYFSREIVAPYPTDGGRLELVYLHKFEMCINTIHKRCWDEGIFVLCISQRSGEFRSIEKPSD